MGTNAKKSENDGKALFHANAKNNPEDIDNKYDKDLVNRKIFFIYQINAKHYN